MTKEIRLPAPHPRFRPRLEGETRRPAHPGTTVRIGEDLFEVVAAEKSGGEWVYRLEPWTGQDTIRVYVDWGEESAREFAAGLRDNRIRERKNLLAWGAQAFLGFLPAKNQEQLYEARGLDPARATFWSAALETVVACPFAVWFVITLVAGGMGRLGGSIPTWAGVLACAAMAEGVFRLAAVISTGEPIGSLSLALLGLRLKSEGPQYVPSDEILAIEGVLNVVSPVPKVWWERAEGASRPWIRSWRRSGTGPRTFPMSSLLSGVFSPPTSKSPSNSTDGIGLGRTSSSPSASISWPPSRSWGPV